MTTRTLATAGAAIAITAVSAVLISRILESRMSIGSSYPPLSSLRSDPEGAKLLHDSLDLIGGMRTKRHFRETRALTCSGASALFLGVRIAAIQKDEIAEVESLARGGCRAVLAVWAAPLRASPQPERPDPPALTQWGLRFPHTGGSTCITAGDDWAPLYRRGDCLIAVERDLEQGSLVVVSEPGLFSNEAIAGRQETGAVAAIIGGSRVVVFDEFHHGISETGSVIGLARRYRLYGFGAVLLVLIALFVWNQSLPFPAEDAAGRRTGNIIEGLSSFAGLVNLLERSVPSQDVPRLAWRRWRTTAGRRLTDKVSAQVESLPDTLKPVELCRAIEAIVNSKSGRKEASAK